MEQLLGLQNPARVATGFDRPNLHYAVLHPQNKMAALEALLNAFAGKSGIVYCATRRETERVCQGLLDRGVSATRYHAGLSEEERRENQEDFAYDRRTVMVATNAFGMGIDKSNVSFVIHYNMPKSLEAYYQEAGRAGRDGTAADCVLLYSPQDIMTAKFLIRKGGENEELPPQERERLYWQNMDRLQTMIDYSTTGQCLRGAILDYFGQTHPIRCGNCGNCDPRREIWEAEEAGPRPEKRAKTRKKDRPAKADWDPAPELPLEAAPVPAPAKPAKPQARDVTVPARMLLTAVQRLEDRRGHPGSGSDAVDLLLGKSYQKAGFGTLSGALSGTPRGEVEAVLQALIAQDYLLMDPEGAVLLSPDADRVLFYGQAVTLRRTDGPERDAVQEALKALRRELAKEEKVPPFLVFTNAALEDMAEKLPATEEELLQVNGVGEYKVKKYGKAILKAIRDGCQKQ